MLPTFNPRPRLGPSPLRAPPLQPARVVVEKAVLSARHGLLLCALFVAFEMCKQLFTYAALDAHGRYPVDGPLLVVAVELVKLLLSAVLALTGDGGPGAFRRAHFSWLFCIPAALMVVNANLFLLALHHASPPLWTVLVQGRILLTAVAYKTFFGRHIGRVRWAALLALTLGVAVSQLKPDLSGLYPSVTALVLAAVTCAISVASSLCVEALQDPQLPLLPAADPAVRLWAAGVDAVLAGQLQPRGRGRHPGLGAGAGRGAPGACFRA